MPLSLTVLVILIHNPVKFTRCVSRLIQSRRDDSEAREVSRRQPGCPLLLAPARAVAARATRASTLVAAPVARNPEKLGNFFNVPRPALERILRGEIQREIRSEASQLPFPDLCLRNSRGSYTFFWLGSP